MSQLSEGAHFLCGTASSLVAKTLTAPLDLVKLFLQVRGPRALVRRVRRGGCAALWAGNTVGLVNQCLYAGLRFYASHALPSALVGGRPLRPAEMALNGAVSGIVAQAAVYPLDLIRTRMVLAPGAGASFGATCASVVRREGVRGLWTGLRPTIAGALPYESSKYLIYSWLRQRRVHTTGCARVSPLMNAVFGAVASVASQTIAYPFETVRRKMMAVGRDGRPLYGSMAECFRRTYAEEGVGGFYRGVVVNALKSIPYAALEYTLYEEMLLRMQSAKGIGND